MTAILVLHAVVVTSSWAQEATPADASAPPLALGEALVAPGTDIDPHGPMRFAVPADLCGRDLGPVASAPAVGPDTDFEDAAFQARARTFADARYLHDLQVRLCTPIYAGPGADAIAAQEPACGQPPEPEAVIHPDHPQVDSQRADVQTAVSRHAAAVERLRVLTELCGRLAREASASDAGTPDSSP